MLLWAEPTLDGADLRVGHIEFFGHKGVDIAAIRRSLPVREGDDWSAVTKKLIREAVAASLGKDATDVAGICCDEQHNILVFIGIPGESFKNFVYNLEPTSAARVPEVITRLHDRLDRANEAAVRKGGDAAAEDDSRGYALTKDPAAHALQLALRRHAIRHEHELFRALEFSSDARQREVASEALGYARQSRRQILALTWATRDPHEGVRNNAARALGVLARANDRLAREIPPDPFIEDVELRRLDG
jgi:hypothetical protein